MNWLIISIIPPVIWAAGNHIDKIVLSKFAKNSSGASLMILTSIASIIVSALIAIINPGKLSFPVITILVLVSVGIFSMFGGIAYVMALKKDNPSSVIPLFQLIPVFNFFLGLIFLHERLSLIQIFGSLTILLGALSLTIEIEGDKFRLKRGVIMLMIVACLVNSVYDLSFKFFGLDNNFWGMIFWIYIGHIIFGLFAFIFVKTWRDEIIGLFTRNNTVMLSLNMVNEFAAIVASIIFNYALLLMPIALVSVVSNGLQPFFVLIFGIILTLIWPTLAHEKLSRRDLMPKIISIVIIFVGTFLLNK